jgi:hypothetical protein
MTPTDTRFTVTAQVDPEALIGIVAVTATPPLTSGEMTARHARDLGRSLVRAADAAEKAAKAARRK